MADDNTKAAEIEEPGVEAGADNGAEKDDAEGGGDDKLTIAQIEEALDKGGNVSKDDVTRLSDHKANEAVKAHMAKQAKEANKKVKADQKKADEDKRKKEIEKLPPEEKLTAVQLEKERVLAEKEIELEQKGYRIKVKAAGYTEIPDGVNFADDEAVDEFVAFLKKHQSKPQKSGDAKKPGQPGGNPAPIPKTVADKLKADSQSRLKRFLPNIKFK